jgi:hypothetical protein
LSPDNIPAHDHTYTSGSPTKDGYGLSATAFHQGNVDVGAAAKRTGQTGKGEDYWPRYYALVYIIRSEVSAAAIPADLTALDAKYATKAYVDSHASGALSAGDPLKWDPATRVLSMERGTPGRPGMLEWNGQGWTPTPFVAVRAHLSVAANIAVPAGPPTQFLPLVWTSEAGKFGPNPGWWDNTAHVFVAPEAGTYRFTAYAQFVGSDKGGAALGISIGTPTAAGWRQTVSNDFNHPGKIVAQPVHLDDTFVLGKGQHVGVWAAYAVTAGGVVVAPGERSAYVNVQKIA